MERAALLRTSGRRLLQRCGRPRPLVAAASSSSAPRRRLSSSSSSSSFSSPGGSSCLLAAAAPLHLHSAGRYWPLTTPGLARRLSVPAVSTSPSPVPSASKYYGNAVHLLWKWPRNDRNSTGKEGWHYELNSPEEEISYKDVVFNEMKGVYSQPDNIMGRVSQQALSPDNTYGVDSGGDPNEIPKLTFEEFKDVGPIQTLLCGVIISGGVAAL